MNNITIIVKKELEGFRLDKYLSGLDLGLTRTAIQGLIEEGNILVNGKKVVKTISRKMVILLILQYLKLKSLK